MNWIKLDNNQHYNNMVKSLQTPYINFQGVKTTNYDLTIQKSCITNVISKKKLKICSTDIFQIMYTYFFYFD
jgi:hypothetical protein